MAVLSGMFPAGETEFLDSVRAYRNNVTDPALKKQIRGFIGQEAHHSNQHKKINAFFKELGYNAVRQEKEFYWIFERVKKMPRRIRLAQTVSAEHITAILANFLLTKSHIVESMEKPVQDLFFWHAIEEIEHKSVAFDVYMDQVGDRKNLRRTFRMMTFLMASWIVISMVRMLWWSKQRPTWAEFKEFWSFLFNKKDGVVTSIASDHQDFYRDDFHPWDHDESELLNTWRTKLGYDSDL